jgi:hypothetical protein
MLQRKLGSDQTMLARLSGLEARIAEALRLAEEAAHRDNVPEMVQVNRRMHSYTEAHTRIHCPSSQIHSINVSFVYMGFTHVFS